MSWRRRFNFRQGAPAWSSGLRPLSRCTAQKPAPPAVVVIDEDDDGGGGSDSEVFIVDDGAAAKAAPSASGSRAKKGDCSSGNVINLDDDDDEEVVEEISQGDKAGPSTAHGAGSPAARTPGCASTRNRYGLGRTSDSSDSDLSERWETASESDDSDSDCEIMDDASGTARKMWETAASSRKKTPNGVHEGNEGMATASTSSSGSERQPGENAGGLFSSECHLDEDIFRFFEEADPQNFASSARDGPTDCNLYSNMYFSDAWKGEQSSACGAKHGHGPHTVSDGKDNLNGNASAERETEPVQNSNGDVKDSLAESQINEQNFSHSDKEGEQNTTGAAEDSCDPSSGLNTNRCSNRNVSSGKRSDSCAGPHFYKGAVPEKASDGIQSPHLDKFVSAKRVFAASSSPYWRYGSPPVSVSTPEKMDEKIHEGVCLGKDQSPSDAYNVTSGRCSLSEKDPVDDPRGLGQFTFVQGASDLQNGLIGEREKHKETAEFKRAAEEEWASRQRQLQIQAEEAQKLRKRKKAEALRLLNMEKKQKQRLEEVRESQKKNEEETQLKEQYRCVVRKELDDTERRCRDTPSILRELGIRIEGGEVRAALKQAQVKFHPDRVSRSDIYQQVKAEETFKFICRLKDKLPSFL